MTHGSQPGSILDGLIVLSLLWFSWSALSWLANQARADRGVLGTAVQNEVVLFNRAIFNVAVQDKFIADHKEIYATLGSPSGSQMNPAAETSGETDRILNPLMFLP